MYYTNGYTYSKPSFYGPGQPPEESQYQFTKVDQFKSNMNKLSNLSLKDQALLLRHYTDWLEYLFSNVTYVSKESGVSEVAWKMRRVIIVVPNRWEHDQRILLKEAIVKAGWVDSSNQTKIKFLRECEATLHCLIKNDLWMSQSGKLTV